MILDLIDLLLSLIHLRLYETPLFNRSRFVREQRADKILLSGCDSLYIMVGIQSEYNFVRLSVIVVKKII
jgi:hypothetical protein